jgi:8-oxo-dGTP pyrophosphatase MutT (NUDIX family)
MTLGARVMFINAKGEICLIKHGYVAGWQLPGGGVDRGQTIEEAAARELEEEAGFTPLGRMQLFALYKNLKASPRDHVAMYICRSAKPLAGFTVDGVEITELAFFAPDALPADITGSARRRIMEVTQGIEPDLYW